ncbi:unnamed protein product, partial [Meganyctiphanes norvegica]
GIYRTPGAAAAASPVLNNHPASDNHPALNNHTASLFACHGITYPHNHIHLRAARTYISFSVAICHNNILAAYGRKHILSWPKSMVKWADIGRQMIFSWLKFRRSYSVAEILTLTFC